MFNFTYFWRNSWAIFGAETHISLEIFRSECLCLMIYIYACNFSIDCWWTCRWPIASWQARRGGGGSCAPRWGWASPPTCPRARSTSAWSPAKPTLISNPSGSIGQTKNFLNERGPGCPVVVKTAALHRWRLVLRKIQFELRSESTSSEKDLIWTENRQYPTIH